MTETGRTIVFAGLFGWLFIITVTGAQEWFVSKPEAPPTIMALGILVPVVMLSAFYRRHGWLRSYADNLDLRVLLGMNLIRFVTGAFYLVTYTQGKFPAGFAIPAGVGDIVAALACIPLLYLIGKGSLHARSLLVGWNIFGMLDFIVGTAAGVLYSVSSFGLLRGGGPSTELLAQLPFCMIPTFVLPLLISLHLLMLHRLKNVENR